MTLWTALSRDLETRSHGLSHIDINEKSAPLLRLTLDSAFGAARYTIDPFLARNFTRPQMCHLSIEAPQHGDWEGVPEHLFDDHVLLANIVEHEPAQVCPTQRSMGNDDTYGHLQFDSYSINAAASEYRMRSEPQQDLVSMPLCDVWLPITGVSMVLANQELV